MSHTVTVHAEFTDKGALGAAVEHLGGQVLGEGAIRFHDGTIAVGFAFKLRGWQYPIVLVDGQLKFDDYEGAWGNRADLELLKAEYLLSRTVNACAEMGWLTERQGDGSVLVFHPAEPGATLTVSAKGDINANGFQGGGCKAAVETLAVALGSITSATVKSETALVSATAQQLQN